MVILAYCDCLHRFTPFLLSDEAVATSRLVHPSSLYDDDPCNLVLPASVPRCLTLGDVRVMSALQVALRCLVVCRALGLELVDVGQAEGHAGRVGLLA